jgi:hypothetical protein
VSYFLLPVHLGLAINLRGRTPRFATVEENGADNDLRAHDGLVVVDMGGAVGAVIAVDRLT